MGVRIPAQGPDELLCGRSHEAAIFTGKRQPLQATFRLESCGRGCERLAVPDAVGCDFVC